MSPCLAAGGRVIGRLTRLATALVVAADPAAVAPGAR
jgi:hypothetical protein